MPVAVALGNPVGAGRAPFQGERGAQVRFEDRGVAERRGERSEQRRKVGPLRAALASYTKLYAAEYGPLGIRMNNALPGFTKDDPSIVPAEWTQNIPLRRAQSTAELARVIRFLASDESAYITGQNLRADGGETRSL
ncbi:SDR family oxidoreductase [Microbacterium sp. A204]|uniref:SDR family oxidoreductase n=1 Tax=Microbacterium sp. A204 TaxID=3457321 RepID=UPI003FD643AD